MSKAQKSTLEPEGKPIQLQSTVILLRGYCVAKVCLFSKTTALVPSDSGAAYTCIQKDELENHIRDVSAICLQLKENKFENGRL